MRETKKVYIVESYGNGWSAKDKVKTTSAQQAIEEVKNRDRKHFKSEDKFKVDTEFTYKAYERIDPTNEIELSCQRSLDASIDNALWHAENLVRNMQDLVERLKFQRESGSYNLYGEIQSSGSCVEVEVGKITALQEMMKTITGKWSL